MKRTFYQHCLVLLLLFFASTALSDRGVEEQKAKLLDLIVESEDPEVRKKLLQIYTNLVVNTDGITGAAPASGGSAGVIRFSCVYPFYSNEDSHKQRQADFQFEFILDERKRKDYFVGSVGVEELIYIPNSRGWNFLEVTGTGNILSTTITKQLDSVHSRNTVLTGGLVATQYYGDCIKK